MVAAAGGGASSSCLSLFGLAYDATEREVHVLFSGCAGYVRCIVVPGKGSQRPYAFVQFSGQQEALVAMESRQGTTWEDGAQAVSIEVAKRDIPDKFTPRQTWGTSHQAPAASGISAQTVSPPLKRPRTETVTSLQTYTVQPVAEVVDGPKTLHLGGLPPGLMQADLDGFLTTNFGNTCVGGTLDVGGGRPGANSSPRAFVGFTSHQAAADAQGMLEGFNWDGSQLRAEWARTEYRPPGARPSPAAPAVPAGPTRVPPPAHRPATHWEQPQEAVQRWDDRGQGARCTLHFTNLPFINEADFSTFLQGTFPEQVICAHFKETNDGRPPIAWVLFVDEEYAATAIASNQSFNLHGSQVQVQYARTEMDPNKFRR